MVLAPFKLWPRGGPDVEVLRAVRCPDRGLDSPTEYELAVTLLLKALQSQAPGEPARSAVLRVAHEAGREIAEELRKSLGRRRVGAERALSAIESVLWERGYEPYLPRQGEIRLKNCPFHHLSAEAPDWICGMNHAFVEGIARGLGNESLEVALEPPLPSAAYACVCRPQLVAKPIVKLFGVRNPLLEGGRVDAFLEQLGVLTPCVLYATI